MSALGGERLIQVIEGKSRVDESSLFDQSLHPVVRDHCRTVSVFLENGVEPGNKGRNYVCRRLLRRMLKHLSGGERLDFDDWLTQEQDCGNNAYDEADGFGESTWTNRSASGGKRFGILPEEVELIK